MRKRVLSFLAALGLSLALLAAPIYAVGTQPRLLSRLFLQTAPPSETGLPAAEYPAVARAIADYLAGRTAVFQHAWTDADGAEHLCFNAREQAHMADCRALYTLCRRIALGSAALCLLSAAGLLIGRLGFSCGAAALGLGLLPGLMLVPLLFALFRFDAVFLLFHRLAFTNELWLLDPQTDLLIRLMPTAFFTAAAGGIALLFLGASAGGVVLLLLLRRKQHAQHQHVAQL